MLSCSAVAVFQFVCKLWSAGVIMSEVKERIKFVTGDMAVYPSHGVGQIENIKVQTVGGIDQTFYVLKILDNDMTIMTVSYTHLTLPTTPYV